MKLHEMEKNHIHNYNGIVIYSYDDLEKICEFNSLSNLMSEIHISQIAAFTFNKEMLQIEVYI